MRINLERSDFRDNPDDGTSFFEDVLNSIDIDKEQWDNINSVEIHIVGTAVNIFPDNQEAVVTN